jgi:7,8-dihydropterin-6-yl-methyl-4-(beta-D-ribofuranosyl)aminobenzene 5'-phosphate synthase
MVDNMEVIALIENVGLLDRKGLRTEHGLSLFIFSKDQQILFDTGISGNFHLNAQKLNVNTTKATLAVISHHHFDHGGGLATWRQITKPGYTCETVAPSSSISTSLACLDGG